jgi:NADPH:quinone reductase-like Zn-dependent oxidoreductase
MLLEPLLSLVLNLTGPRKIRGFITKLVQQDLEFLGTLLESGKITPVIDRRYSLRDLPEAVRYLEEGHARGKVVITVERSSNA